MRNILFVLTLFFSFNSIYSQTYYSDAIDGRVIFKLKDNVKIDGFGIQKPKDHNIIGKTENIADYPILEKVLKNYSITKLERPSYYTGKTKLIRIFFASFSNYSEIDNLIKDLQALDIIEYAEKQYIRKISLIPNDTYWDNYNNWYLTQVNASQAWDISQGNSNIKVAIVDNAVFCGHNDLTTYSQRDVADGDNDATPPEDANADFTWSHGTHCAGLATADINNGIGIASLGAGVELIGVKCTPNSGTSGSVYYGYEGMQWACENGANVISMSWGGGGYGQSEQDLINSYPTITFFAAAGNDGVSTEMYPGAYDNVICVGSVDSDDSRSSFSNYNGSTTWVDIASPGGYSNSGLMSTVYTTTSGYGRMGGTSMATPFAAGLAGLMLSLNPSLSPSEILNCLVSSGVTINQSIGPRINAYATMQCVQSTLTGDPNANFFANNTTITVGNAVTFTDLSSDGGNTITNWQWTFTGGTPSSHTGETPPAITYSNTGTYTVELIVTNPQNSDTETKTNYITVTEEPYGAWIEQASAFTTASRGINCISIVDENTVWATAYDGSGGNANVQQFTKTTNGGTTWTTGNINLGNTTLGIAMIDAISATTAYVAACIISSGSQGIYITTNSGATWTRQTTASFTNSSSFTNVVHFWDANNGFCMGDPINGEYEIYTTINGGTNWILVNGSNIPAPLTGEYGYTGQMESVGNDVWFTTNKGRIYHSADKGYTWDVFTTPLTDFGGTTQSGQLSFKDANNGLIISNTNVVYKTTNGGANWNIITPTGTTYANGLCWIEGTDIIFSTGANPAGSSYSEDAGTSWISIDTEQHLYVEFLNQSTGWSGGFNTDATTKGMWKWAPTSNLNPAFSAAPATMCVGTTTQFNDQTTGGTVTSWNWDFPGGTPSTSSLQNPTVTYNTAGIYNVSLTVNDGNGPTSITISNYITVNNVPAQPSTIVGETLPCQNYSETYSVTNVPGVVYTWTLPSDWTGTSVTNSINATVGTLTGTISVTPSNTCGNGTPRTLNITSLSTMPNASFTFVDNNGTVTFTSTSTGGTSYYWDFGDGTNSNLENTTHTYGANGNYTVTLTVTNACGNNTYTENIDITSLNVLNIDGYRIAVYPNPTSNFINIDTKANSNIDYKIYDITGKIVTTGIIKVGETHKSISVNKFNLGIYNLKLTINNKSINQKIIIK